jgi:hypothetical protein
MGRKKSEQPAFDHAAQIVFTTVGKVLAEANRLFAAGQVEEALLNDPGVGAGALRATARRADGSRARADALAR